MTQLAIGYAERIASAITVSSASYSTLSVPQVAAAALTPGTAYLILARGQFDRDAIGAACYVKMRHGTTDFAGSESIFTSNVSANDQLVWSYMTVWTAVAAEDLTIQVKSDGTTNWNGRWISIAAIPLTGNFTLGTDYFFNEATSSTTLTGTLQTGATLTFTPGSGGQTWLVMSSARITQDTTADYFVSRLDRTGEATTGWEVQQAGRAIGDVRTNPNVFIGSLGAVSQTFREQAKRVGTTAATAARTRSAVFALNLAKFDAFTYISNDAKIDLAIGAYTTAVNAISHPQAVASGNVLLLGFGVQEPTADTGQRYYSGRVQVDNIDAFSSDGVTSTYTAVATPRWFYPGSSKTAQSYPWFHASVETMAAGTRVVDWDAAISAANAGRGIKYRRLLALSLDVTAAVAPGGGGLPISLERNEQIMYLRDYDNTRRRVNVRLVDATDGVTPETGEAGGQPQISKNGAALSTTSVGVLVAVSSAKGLYYTELVAANLDTLGSLRIEYKSANTQEWTVTLPVEELPWLDDGTAQAGAAQTITLRSGAPTVVPLGSIVRIMGGTGAGQMNLITSYNTSTKVAGMEQAWATVPDSTSQYLVLPGPLPITPAVNAIQVDGSSEAATKLRQGAESLSTGAIVAGTNTTGTITTDLPITVGGSAVGTDFYKGAKLNFRDGVLDGQTCDVLGSSTVSSKTVLTVSTLTVAPVVGQAFTR